MVFPIAYTITIIFSTIKNIKDVWSKIIKDFPIIAVCLGTITATLAIYFYLIYAEMTDVIVIESIVVVAILIILSFISIIDLITKRSESHQKEIDAVREDGRKAVLNLESLLLSIRNKSIYDEMLITVSNMTGSLDKICKGCSGKEAIKLDCEFMYKRIKFLDTSIKSILNKIEVLPLEDKLEEVIEQINVS